jgi:uncharacterized protein (TIRG00374 family)
MTASIKSPLSKLRRTNIIYPIIFGIGVVVYMFVRKFDPAVFKNISFTASSYLWLFVACCLMAMRDIGYMTRLKILSDNKLTWRQSFRIVMLWEFTSAITPSAVGGTSVAIIFVNKEGISIGKSSAIVMATSFLDELYFILTFPFILLFINSDRLFNVSRAIGGSLTFANEFFLFALIGYSVKFVYTIAISYGLFVNPRGLKWMLLWIFKLPLIRRWRQEVNEAGTEIISSSYELRKKPFVFWLKAFGTTAISWTSRYCIVNALFMAFFVVPDHFLVFARQLVAWIMMLVSPTPGGSGFSEFIFIRYFSELIQVSPELKESLAAIVAFLWRLISYYPYLLIGSIIFPKWIKTKFGSGSKSI